MNFSVTDYRRADAPLQKFRNGSNIHVRDKSYMRQRMTNTLFMCFENVHIEEWDIEDTSAAITYEFATSFFGEILVAATAKGVCYLGFTNNDPEATFKDLTRRFPRHDMVEDTSIFQNEVVVHMNNPTSQLPVHLHLKGTEFQLNIWKKLVQIPFGGLVSYSNLVGDKKAARAAGSAVGRNPVGFILPCHRVIHNDGSFDDYFWGSELKHELLTWEATVSTFLLG